MFRVVTDFENYWKWFNREPRLSEQLISWAHGMRIECVEDHLNPYGSALYWHGERGILYNPHLPEAEKILVLGHEIGHHLLGHVYQDHVSGFQKSSLFSHYGPEKDASIVGLLCMIPNTTIFRLINEERLDAEALFYEYRHLWADLDEEYSIAICNARLRIFNALLRACQVRGRIGKEYLSSKIDCDSSDSIK